MTGLVVALLLQAQSDPIQFFEEKVRPLLAARCWGCHGDAKVSGLRLDSREREIAFLRQWAPHELALRKLAQYYGISLRQINNAIKGEPHGRGRRKADSARSAA